MRRGILFALFVLAPWVARPDVLIRGARLYDGTGAPGRVTDVRVTGERITEVGSGLTPRDGEAVAPAFLLAQSCGYVDLDGPLL